MADEDEKRCLNGDQNEKLMHNNGSPSDLKTEPTNLSAYKGRPFSATSIIRYIDGYASTPARGCSSNPAKMLDSNDIFNLTQGDGKKFTTPEQSNKYNPVEDQYILDENNVSRMQTRTTNRTPDMERIAKFFNRSKTPDQKYPSKDLNGQSSTSVLPYVRDSNTSPTHISISACVNSSNHANETTANIELNTCADSDIKSPEIGHSEETSNLSTIIDNTGSPISANRDFSCKAHRNSELPTKPEEIEEFQDSFTNSSTCKNPPKKIYVVEPFCTPKQQKNNHNLLQSNEYISSSLARLNDNGSQTSIPDTLLDSNQTQLVGRRNSRGTTAVEELDETQLIHYKPEGVPNLMNAKNTFKEVNKSNLGNSLEVSQKPITFYSNSPEVRRSQKLKVHEHYNASEAYLMTEADGNSVQASAGDIKPELSGDISTNSVIRSIDTKSTVETSHIKNDYNANLSRVKYEPVDDEIDEDFRGPQANIDLLVSRKKGMPLDSGSANHNQKSPYRNERSTILEKNNIIVSEEGEMTQELPELFEGDAGNQNETPEKETEEVTHESDILSQRREVKRTYTNIFEIDSSLREKSSPEGASPTKLKKIHQSYIHGNNGTPDQISTPIASKSTFTTLSNNFPHDYRTEDFNLSISDIIFPNAVWCQYSIDFKYYPGIIIALNELDTTTIRFEDGEYEVKYQDIYFLDIRIGDKVEFNGDDFIVEGLECKTYNLNNIRCVRGYDTVHLRKLNSNGKLGRKTVMTSLGSIKINLCEWTNRQKLGTRSTKGEVIEQMEFGLRGRRSISNTPSKPESLKYNHPLISLKSKVEIISPIRRVPYTPITRSSPIKQCGIKEINSETKDSLIFDRCLFVLSNINVGREELAERITREGGLILNDGLSALIEKPVANRISSKVGDIVAYNLRLQFVNDINIAHYDFACVLSHRHLRSLKYLEALLLRWPTLHTKYITDSLVKKEMNKNQLISYLLPSGASRRLSDHSPDDIPTIKSSDISNFISNMKQSKSLKSQTTAMQEIMTNYCVLIMGDSELNEFLNFAFTCLGAARIYYTSRKYGRGKMDKDFIIKLTEWAIQDFSERTEFNGSLKLLLYLNLDDQNLSLDIEYGLVESCSKLFESYAHKEKAIDIQVGSKEWLIQTIINESTGFT